MAGPSGGYLSPTGQYPGFPPTGNFPLTGVPIAQPNLPGSDAFAALYQPAYFPPPPVTNQPLWYLGTPIPDPHAPAAHYGAHKVPDYDPALTYHSVVKAINSGHESQCQSISSIFKIFLVHMYLINVFFSSIQHSAPSRCLQNGRTL